MDNTAYIALGSIKNVLKRIGSYENNLFCMGEDPVTKSGIIVSKGEIVSSKILDIAVKNDNDGNVISLKSHFLNKVEVTYVDVKDKTVKVMSFSILNDEALNEIINFICEKRQEENKLDEMEKNITVLQERLEKQQQFILQNKNNIELIENLNQIVNDLTKKVNTLMFQQCYGIDKPLR